MTRDQILAEIRRTADPDTGKALGRLRFAAETGIREYEWTRYWPRWSEAVKEAGCTPADYQGRLPDDELLRALAAEVRGRGRMPTFAELRVRSAREPGFPTHKTFARLGGSKAGLERMLAAFCEANDEFADVRALLSPSSPEPDVAEEPADPESKQTSGHVYMLKSGRHYKIGLTTNLDQRMGTLAIQLPERAKRVHVIATDDPVGIERYWHARFADRRANGEWFELTAADVAAFRRRKFM